MEKFIYLKKFSGQGFIEAIAYENDKKYLEDFAGSLKQF